MPISASMGRAMAEHKLSFGLFGVGAGRSARADGFVEVRAGGTEAGVSGSGGGGVYPALYAPFSPPARRWGSYWDLGPVSPRLGWGGAGGATARFFFDPGCEDEPRHYLDACTLCKKPLEGQNIYMYRGNIPYCSEECRQEQILMDVDGEKKNLSLSMKASSPGKEQRRQKRKASQDIQVPAAGTVVAG